MALLFNNKLFNKRFILLDLNAEYQLFLIYFFIKILMTKTTIY